jgi:hypothetical protein
MKTRRGAKRLTRLVISEVSAVDRGAGEGVRIALVKRAAKGERWAGNFDGAIGLDKAGNRKPAKKAKRIKSDMGKPISATTKATNPAPAPAPVIEEEHPMPKVSNAVAAMSERADEILKSDSSIRSRESAIAKVAVSADPRDRQIWDAYRADFDAPAQAEPAPIAKVSSAYTQLMAKASILAKKIGVSEAVAFSKIYTAPENWGLVQPDKAFNYARMAGEPAAEVEPAAARQRGRRPEIFWTPRFKPTSTRRSTPRSSCSKT